MKELHKSSFIKIVLNQEKSIFHFYFFDLSTLTQDLLKEELKNQAFLAEKYCPKSFIFHSENFNFSIVPEFQTWIDKNIFPRYIKAGVKKFAYIISSDMISQLSIEQVMEEEISSQGFETRYFDDEDDAKTWIDEA